jgi:excinuclease ABC subunit A
LGPGAGKKGGKIIAEGNLAEIMANQDSLIKNYLKMGKQLKKELRKADGSLKLWNCRRNNLKLEEINIPTGMLIGICGVSGSGKSTLCEDVIYESYLKGKAEGCDKIVGLENFDRVIFKEQKILHKSGISTPATYLGFLKDIGKIITLEQKKSGITIAANIFNYAGKQGQCPECKGMGYAKQ